MDLPLGEYPPAETTGGAISLLNDCFTTTPSLLLNVTK
jgi:hypothetical protein